MTGGYGGEHGATGLLRHLLSLSDQAVLDILAVVMGETLDVGTTMIEGLGCQLRVDMADNWEADASLLDGIRDKGTLNAMLAALRARP